MPVEGANFIRELTPATPGGGAPVSEGDNELTQLKDVFVNQFSGLRADSSNIPVTAGAEDMNNTGRIDFGENVVVQASWEFTFGVNFIGSLFMRNAQTIVSELADDTTQSNMMALNAFDTLVIGDSVNNIPITLQGTGLKTIEGDVNVEGDTDLGGELALTGISTQGFSGTETNIANVAVEVPGLGAPAPGRHYVIRIHDKLISDP